MQGPSNGHAVKSFDVFENFTMTYFKEKNILINLLTSSRLEKSRRFFFVSCLVLFQHSQEVMGENKCIHSFWQECKWHRLREISQYLERLLLFTEKIHFCSSSLLLYLHTSEITRDIICNQKRLAEIHSNKQQLIVYTRNSTLGH